jgi:DNA-binding NarL/FixJ family response regulator
MMIADNESALYLPDPELPEGATTRSPGLVALLQRAFDSVWSTGKSLDAARKADSLTESHREILMLVIGGKTNDAIARIMQVSPKTVRRRLDDLLTHFNTRDRATLIATALREGS